MGEIHIIGIKSHQKGKIFHSKKPYEYRGIKKLGNLENLGNLGNLGNLSLQDRPETDQ